MSTVFGLPLLNWKLDAPYSGDRSDECGWIPAQVEGTDIHRQEVEGAEASASNHTDVQRPKNVVKSHTKLSL